MIYSYGNINYYYINYMETGVNNNGRTNYRDLGRLNNK